MSTTVEHTMMLQVHELAVAEWGRMAAPLAMDGLVQPLHFPAGRYATIVMPASPDTIQIRQPVGRPDLTAPGLAQFLLREHSSWLLGRLELVEDALLVTHVVPLAQLTGEVLCRAVMAVHASACRLENDLHGAGAIEPLQFGETDEEDAE